MDGEEGFHRKGGKEEGEGWREGRREEVKGY